jgi:hypothetical protein
VANSTVSYAHGVWLGASAMSDSQDGGTVTVTNSSLTSNHPASKGISVTAGLKLRVVSLNAVTF